MTALGIRPGNFRDLLAQEDIAQKAELGWLNIEFSMFGCAYLEPKTREMKYRISSRIEDIYNFTAVCEIQDIIPSKVEKLSFVCPVPEGTQDIIETEIKKTLGRQLRRLYPKDVFEVLNQYAIRNDSAADLLWSAAEEIEGHFREDELDDLKAFLDYSYQYHIITKYEYEKIAQWLKEEKQNIYDDISAKGVSEKEIHGLLCADANGAIRFITDARKENVLKKIMEIELNSGIVSPVYTRSYSLKQGEPVGKVAKLFKEELKQKQDSNLMDTLIAIRNKKNDSEKESFLAEMERIRVQAGEAAADLMKWYGIRWGIL